MNDNNNQDIDMKNRAHIQKIYVDKALRYLKFCIGIFAFSGFSYLIALLYNAFDFGLIFEIISFVFVIISINRLKQNQLQASKKSLVISMIPIGWLIIYDFINLLANSGEVTIEVIHYYTSLDQYFYYLAPYLVDVTLIALIVLLYKSYSSVNRADGTTVSNNYTDTFYDKL